MANDWTEWADGNDLAGMSRGSDVLGSLGYDPEEARANPAMQAEIRNKLASPYQNRDQSRGQDRSLIAQNRPPAAALLGRTAPPAPAATPAPAAAPAASAGGNTGAPPRIVDNPQEPLPDTLGGEDSNAPAPTRFTPPSGEPPNPVLHQRPDPNAVPTDQDQVAPAAGGTAAPAAAGGSASAAVSPSGTTGAPGGAQLQDETQQAITGELSATNQARNLYTGVPNEPDTSAIDARIDAASIPPHEGAKEYKPSAMQRVGRGIKSAVVGFATGGIPGAIVGAVDPKEIRGGTAYGAPNKQYGEDLQNQRENLALQQQNKAEMLARYKLAVDARTGKAKNLQSTLPGYKDAGTTAIDAFKASTDQQKAATDQVNAGINQQREDREENAAEPAAKTALSQAEFDQLGKQADRLGLSGQMRTLYVANKGKLPDPRQATGDEIARGQALKTFRQQYGRGPISLDEINDINASASGRLKDTSNDPAVGAIVAQATGKKQIFEGGYTRMADGRYQKTGSYKQTDILSPTQYQQKVDEFRVDANKALVPHGAEIDEGGQVVRKRGSGAAAPPAAAAMPAVSSQSSPTGTVPPPGATAAVRKDGRIVGHVVAGKFVALTQ